MNPDSVEARVADAMAPYLESGSLPGYVAAVSIAGERRVLAAGLLGVGSGTAMEVDTVFRIASLSKLVGAVLALILEERGTLSLEDEVAGWLPELAAPRVIREMDGPLDETVAVERPIIVRDLLTMTSGLGLVLTPGPLQAALRAEGLMPGPFPPPFSHDEFMVRLGALPLVLQPGAGWLYHTGVDVLSVLMARAAGRSLGELLAEEITGPLGLTSMAFHATDLERFATAYTPSGDGLELLDLPSGRFSRPPRFETLGSGLVASAPDYLSFLEMLGRWGAPILGAEAVRRMGSDQMTEHQRGTAQLFLGSGRSWGLGCEVVIGAGDTAIAPGAFGWMGGTGTSAYIDPGREVAGVLFTQVAMPSNRPPPMFVDFWEAVYGEL
ncbi:MAG: serine hydrolase domain-containing protein [Solirubrobacteraceae bacterium]